MKKLFLNPNFKWIASVAGVICIVFIAKDVLADYRMHQAKENASSGWANMPYIAQPADTIPQRRESIQIQKQTNDKSVKLSMENGEVTDLEIDGKKIDKQDYDKYKGIIDDVNPKSSRNGSGQTFIFGDDDNFGLGNIHIYRDSLSNMFGDNFFKGFNGDGLKGMMEEFSRSFGSFDFTNNLDSLLNRLKESGSQSFGFTFPDNDDLDKNQGIWIDKLDENSGNADNQRGKTTGSKDVNLTEILGNALNYDGMLLPEVNNKVEITGKYLKINGEKQPTNIFEKYKRILEEESGLELQKDSRLRFNVMGKVSKRKYRTF
ncbi:MAG TPA: hypothetical protein PK047_09105 [Saprospiraceae bacterium]|nr:hypothetical protein [Saprospiraceae bacterium]HRP42253.1 hypothetical protein [Saprospiraceae bacterium]